MSKFTGNIGREEEDGLGWEGLVPSKDEKDSSMCTCRKSDAWRCAVDQNLLTVSCHCRCHRFRGERR